MTITHELIVDGIGPIEITLTEYGHGRAFLLLHGGAGPRSVGAFAELLATAEDALVIVPVHPGFDGTPRPESLSTVAGLAALYIGLLDRLDLADVTVIGNSIGGWIAAEIALLASPRVTGFILVDAVGIEVDGHPIADFFSLTLDQVFTLSYHNPEPFRIDLTKQPPAAQAVAAGNRAALATYAGTSMTDPSLIGRLAGVRVPTLVVWGESDRMVDPDYGRAFAAAIPGAEFRLLTSTGHMPHLETPDAMLRVIRESVVSVD
jgi:pimeloyl-ACP methyl ester carboxylesterase